MRMDDQRLTRRGSLLKLGGAGLAAALGWKAVEARGAEAGPAAVASGAVSCVLTPEQTEGPYFLPGDKIRRNVTEGKPGVRLTLKLTVLDVSTCKPIKGAAVDIWHCDAVGTYAAVTNATFLRGIKKTNAKGVATFKTIYPGWYQGRTVHIHAKESLGGNVVHTGQLYFPDTLTDKVYTRSPYNTRPGRTTRNPDDSIYRNGGSRSTLKLRKVESAYTGSITMGVQRS
jgi:protocatechuate 3,4-dioxygenase beta subunit